MGSDIRHNVLTHGRTHISMTYRLALTTPYPCLVGNTNTENTPSRVLKTICSGRTLKSIKQALLRLGKHEAMNA